MRVNPAMEQITSSHQQSGTATISARPAIARCQHTGVTIPECSCATCSRELIARNTGG